MAGTIDDPMVLAIRHDGYFCELVEVPGKDLPLERLGSMSAGVVVSHRRDDAAVIVDLGGGYGGPVYEKLHENGIQVIGHKGAEKTTRRTADRKLGFVNLRSAVYWAFREALDPDQPGGSPIAMPPDSKLYGELTTPTFDVTPNGIRVETKEDVVALLGRSPDRAEAAVMAWSGGASSRSHGNPWAQAARDRRRMMPYGDSPYHRPRPQVLRW